MFHVICYREQQRTVSVKPPLTEEFRLSHAYHHVRWCFASCHSVDWSPYLTKWSPKRAVRDSISVCVCVPVLSDDLMKSLTSQAFQHGVWFLFNVVALLTKHNMVPHSGMVVINGLISKENHARVARVFRSSQSVHLSKIGRLVIIVQLSFLGWFTYYKKYKRYISCSEWKVRDGETPCPWLVYSLHRM